MITEKEMAQYIYNLLEETMDEIFSKTGKIVRKDIYIYVDRYIVELKGFRLWKITSTKIRLEISKDTVLKEVYERMDKELGITSEFYVDVEESNIAYPYDYVDFAKLKQFFDWFRDNVPKLIINYIKKVEEEEKSMEIEIRHYSEVKKLQEKISQLEDEVEKLRTENNELKEELSRLNEESDYKRTLEELENAIMSANVWFPIRSPRQLRAVLRKLFYDP